jgi:peptidyl-prolyl cis-trans isomerase D
VFFDPNVYVADNTLSVQDDEIKNYYNQHKEDYKVEEGRKLRAAIFPLLSSRQDTIDVKNIMDRVTDDLKKGIDFKSLIELHSEVKYLDTVYSKHGQIGSDELEKKVFDAKEGEIVGPVLDEGAYRMIKVFSARSGKDTYVRTSQILVKFNSANKDSIKNFASDLVKRIKKGENINELAKKYSEDPSAKLNSGDQGWRGKGQFVKPYEDAMFAGKTGDVVGPIETVYGFHVIKITGKDSRELNIGDLRLSILPSSQTKEDIFNKSRDFMNLAKEGDFVREAELSKAEFHETQMFVKGGTVPGIGYHTGVNKFAFNNEVGSVSEVYRIGNAYVVFQVAEERKAGYKDIAEVKETIKNTLLFEKKMAKLKDIVSDMRNKLGANDSIDKLNQIDSRLKVVTTGSFVPNTSIPGIGRDVKLIGKIMGLSAKTVSSVIEGSRGCYIFYLFSKSSFDQTDYNSKRNNLYMQALQEKQNHFYTEYRRILTEKADIVDNRDKFYR